MARPKNVEVEEIKTKSNKMSELSKLMKDNAEFHLNDKKEVYYKVSTGSLILDQETNGGITPGVIRMAGPTETGKTSEAFEMARNFLIKFPSKGRVCLVKAEGRLSPEIKERTGLKFVYDISEWHSGTCFVFECNIYETVIELMRTCVVLNEDDDIEERYMFIIDSMDGLTLKDDSKKPIDAENRVAGCPALSKKMLQKMSSYMCKMGHIVIMLSQVSAEIALNPYAPKDPRIVRGSGGNSISHWANWIFEFSPNYKSNKILTDPSKPIDRIKNRPLGHYVKVEIKKSPNETTNLQVEYPIKYGVKNGSSIWKEMEIIDFLLANGLIQKAGAWLNVEKSLKKELEDEKFEIPEKIQGLEKARIWLESNSAIRDYLYSRILLIISVAT